MKQSVVCQQCNGRFDLEIFNAGHGDVEFLYCGSCPRVVVVRIYEDLIPRGFYEPPYDYELPPSPSDSDFAAKRKAIKLRIKALVDSLDSCSCGGRFDSGGTPKCPRCQSKLDSESVRDQIARSMKPHEKQFVESWEGWGGGSFAVVDGLIVEPKWRLKRAPKEKGVSA